jgi:hypothetical protein
MRLKQFDKAEKCIAQALEAENQAPSSEALQSLMSQAKFYGLLAQVHERSGKALFIRDISAHNIAIKRYCDI